MCETAWYKVNILLLIAPLHFLNCAKMAQIVTFRRMRLAGTLGNLSHLSSSKIKLLNSSRTNVQTRPCILFPFSRKIFKRKGLSEQLSTFFPVFNTTFK